MNLPKLVKYTSKDCRCVCGGPAMISGTSSVRLPFGLGFAPGSSRFQIDCVTYRGFIGECMDCGQALLFWQSRKASTRFPKSINRKLEAMRL